MAKATVDTVTKTVSKEVAEKVYVLTLTEDEAMSLRALTGVGRAGDGIEPTYWKHTDDIYNTLRRAGVPAVWSHERFTFSSAGFQGKRISN
jgi:predicted short-subunit dehydrogenase-like oxidoreductase (DUF2520 family)